MNVDIRIVIDVTQGELDLFMSPQEDSFVVLTNQTNGYHDIFLDNRFKWLTDIDGIFIEPLNVEPYNLDINRTMNNAADGLLNESKPSMQDCRTFNGEGFYVKDKQAFDLSTYITLDKCNTLLRVFGLKNRLVLTLPQNAHNLSATRFFMALKASTSASFGLVFFRQDQLHIDLFVFFSVFFSCFFLFLAVCVVAWKAKQAADIRRARRRHVVEMLHMAKRPFATITLLLGPGSETPIQNRRRGRTASKLSQQPDIKPVAVEPTADNVAAVCTVFIRLPGKSSSPVALALASSLTVLSRQYPSGGRAFLRRRGSHHAIVPPNN